MSQTKASAHAGPGDFVDAPQGDGLFPDNILLEGTHLFCCHRPALQGEAYDRVIRQFVLVAALYCAKVTFRGHMQAYRFDHGRPEIALEPCGPDNFMTVVDASRRGMLARIVHHMTDIVQEGRHHQSER